MKSIAALARLIYKTHLKELIYDLEYEFLRVEIVKLLTHSFVYVIEMQSMIGPTSVVG